MITRSSHYDDIRMKSLSLRQFHDAFSNESGDVAIQFNGITTRLTARAEIRLLQLIIKVSESPVYELLS